MLVVGVPAKVVGPRRAGPVPAGGSGHVS
jgi:hypothetical protein